MSAELSHLQWETESEEDSDELLEDLVEEHELHMEQIDVKVRALKAIDPPFQTDWVDGGPAVVVINTDYLHRTFASFASEIRCTHDPTIPTTPRVCFDALIHALTFGHCSARILLADNVKGPTTQSLIQGILASYQAAEDPQTMTLVVLSDNGEEGQESVAELLQTGLELGMQVMMWAWKDEFARELLAVSYRHKRKSCWYHLDKLGMDLLMSEYCDPEP